MLLITSRFITGNNQLDQIMYMLSRFTTGLRTGNRLYRFKNKGHASKGGFQFFRRNTVFVPAAFLVIQA